MIVIDNILDVEKYVDNLDAVIFDLDDTLYSEKDYVRSGYRKIAEHFAKPELFDQMWKVFERGGKAIDEVLEANGLEAEKEKALHIYRFQEPDIVLYPGVEAMIVRIRMTKRVGIITDGRPEGQNAKLNALRLRSLVDEIIITDELGGVECRKPNPAAFIQMQKIMAAPFEAMCYIGDNIRKDFIAPENLGMRSVYFKNSIGLYYCRDA